MDVFEMIPEELRKLYSLIRRISTSDSDSVTQFHAQQALMQIDQIVAQIIMNDILWIVVVAFVHSPLVLLSLLFFAPVYILSCPFFVSEHVFVVDPHCNSPICR